MSWNRKAIELQTGYLIIHLLMPCFKKTSGAYDAYP